MLGLAGEDDCIVKADVLVTVMIVKAARKDRRIIVVAVNMTNVMVITGTC